MLPKSPESYGKTVLSSWILSNAAFLTFRVSNLSLELGVLEKSLELWSFVLILKIFMSYHSPLRVDTCGYNRYLTHISKLYIKWRLGEITRFYKVNWIFSTSHGFFLWSVKRLWYEIIGGTVGIIWRQTSYQEMHRHFQWTLLDMGVYTGRVYCG